MPKLLKPLAAGAAALTIAATGSPVLAEDVVTANPEATTAQAVKPADQKPDFQAENNKLGEELKARMIEQDAAGEAYEANTKAVEAIKKELNATTAEIKTTEDILKDASPEKIQEVREEKAANLEAQKANETKQAEVASQVADQEKAVADTKTTVNQAEAAKTQAENTIKAKEDNLKAAQDALSGQGLEDAKANLESAKAEVVQKTADVATAEKALDVAKTAGTNRDQAIKQAENNLNIKTDAFNTADARTTKAQNDVNRTDALVAETATALEKARAATPATKQKDIITWNAVPTLGDYKPYVDEFATPEDKEYRLKITGLDKHPELASLTFRDAHLEHIKVAVENGMVTSDKNATPEEHAEVSARLRETHNRKALTGNTFGERIDRDSRISDDPTPVNVSNMTYDQRVELARLYGQAMSDFRDYMRPLSGKPITVTRKATGETKTHIMGKIATGDIKVSDAAMQIASTLAKKMEESGQANHFDLTHNTDGYRIDYNKYVDNLVREDGIAPNSVETMGFLKNGINQAFQALTVGDMKSHYNHLNLALAQGKHIGIAMANVNGVMWSVVVHTDEGTPLPDPADDTTNQEALTRAQRAHNEAQEASNRAKAELAKATQDRVAALELKTQAEQELANVKTGGTNLQVAENNLRLAKIALKSAQDRQEESQKALDNFSAHLVEKKGALDDAKTALATAKIEVTAKETALNEAKAELAKEETKLQALLAERETLANALVELKAKQKELDAKLAVFDKGTNPAQYLAELQAKADKLQKEVDQGLAKDKELKAKLDDAENAVHAVAAKLRDLAKRMKAYEEANKPIATLPNGNVITAPGAVTATTKPVVTPSVAKPTGGAVANGVGEITSSLKADKPEVTLGNQKAAAKAEQAYQAPTALGQTDAFKAKTLPQTSSQDNLAMLALGSLMTTLGFVGTKRKRG